jgi:hypothetical protein
MEAVSKDSIKVVEGLLSCQSLRYDTMIALKPRNGAVVFYERCSMTQLGRTNESQTVRSPLDLGYHYPPEESYS